jgi:acyl carrier protein
MAVASVEQSEGGRPVAHPLLDVRIEESLERCLYISRFSTERFWLLDGHRILGKATLPGTAYLEIAGGAFTDYTGNRTFEIEELYLLTPLTVGDDEQKTVHTVLQKEDGYFTFTIKSRSTGKEGSWQEHSRGRIAALNQSEKESMPLNLQEVAGLCEIDETGSAAGKNSDNPEYLKVSPRWFNVNRWQSGVDQGLAEIELPGDFAADLNSYDLHPALTDSATSFLAAKYQGDDLYLPFLFRGIRVSAPIPRKVFSYSRLKRKTEPQLSPGYNLAFHIIITDEKGKPCMEVEEFDLLKVSPESGRQRAAFEEKAASRPAGRVVKAGLLPVDEVNPLKDGITPVEGVKIFNTLLQGAPPQVLISTSDFKKRLRFLREQKSALKLEVPAGERTGEVAHPRPELSSEYEAPVNPVQRKLSEIWEQFLGIGQIGILDDFFELGGDSLKGLSVISDIHKTFNVEFSISDFFAAPTIQGLAAAIHSGSESIYSSIIPVEKRRYYPLSSAQKRLFFLQQIRPRSVFYNIPGALMVEGNLDKKRLKLLEAAFRTLIIRQSSLRTGFSMIGEQPVQRIYDPADIPFKIKYDETGGGWAKKIVKEQQGNSELEAVSGITADFIRPFDLSCAPLMRVEVIRIGDLKHLWLFDIHHIISDATGFAILYRELFQLYRGEKLQPLKVDYKDFSLWQNNLFETDTLDKQREYWLRLFSGGVPRLDLPTDYPRPKVSRFEGEMFQLRLSREDSLKFLAVGGAAGATMFMNLLAVVNVLLSKYTGSSDIVIGSTHVGRPNADLRDIIGMFVNLLAMRNQPQPDLRYIDFLRKVKDTALKAFENQDMQFEMLVEELNIKVDTTRNPLFDVCINVQNYEQLRIELDDLTFSTAGYKYKNSKFDMLLWADQVEEEIHFMLEYSTELFKAGTIAEFMEHLREIISQVGRDKEIKLKDIDISLNVVNPDVHTPDMDFDF